MGTTDRSRLLRLILTRPHRYRRARAITMSVTLAILFAVPLSGLARLDLWSDANWAFFRPVDFAKGLTAVLAAIVGFYVVTFVVNMPAGRMFCGLRIPEVGQQSAGVGWHHMTAMLPDDVAPVRMRRIKQRHGVFRIPAAQDRQFAIQNGHLPEFGGQGQRFHRLRQGLRRKVPRHRPLADLFGKLACRLSGPHPQFSLQDAAAVFVLCQRSAGLPVQGQQAHDAPVCLLVPRRQVQTPHRIFKCRDMVLAGFVRSGDAFEE